MVIIFGTSNRTKAFEDLQIRSLLQRPKPILKTRSGAQNCANLACSLKRYHKGPCEERKYSDYLLHFRRVPLRKESLLQPSRFCDARRLSASGVIMSSELPALSGLRPPPIPRRKFSFPAALHSNFLGLSEAHVGAGNSARRRFSNVSDVVSRKFSNTLGWRTASVPTQDIVIQGKTLCGQYIRCRLKRSGMFNRKCGLQRLRSVASLPGGYVVREVFPELLSIGQELERMHPKLYTGVARQASPTPAAAVFATDKSVNAVLTSVARELIRNDVTWAKIVSLYAIAGGLAVDCVRQGHPEYLQSLMDSMGEVLEDELAAWIAENGGWAGLLTYCKPPNTDISLAGFVGLLGAVMASALFLFLLLRWFGKFAFI